MKSKTLTTLQAANIGRKMGVRGLCIYRDDVDRNLWKVVTPGSVEAHEPMDEKTWRQFITASGWIETDRKATVPETNESELLNAIRDQLSPEAVASIIAHLQPAHTNDQNVDRQVRWFAAELTKLVGGNEQLTTLMNELNL